MDLERTPVHNAEKLIGEEFLSEKVALGGIDRARPKTACDILTEEQITELNRPLSPQEQLAHVSNYLSGTDLQRVLGVSDATVRNWQGGRATPRDNNRHKLSQVSGFLRYLHTELQAAPEDIENFLYTYSYSRKLRMLQCPIDHLEKDNYKQLLQEAMRSLERARET